jgi:phosphomannomutase/phosphoglucomutase
MPRLFGTSGVRGYTNSEMTPQLVLELAQSYGTIIGHGANVAVGRDTRYGAQMLSSAACAGLVSVGLMVEDCGVLPMAAMASYIVSEKLSGGVLITGSHMPPDRIGLILMNDEGAYTPYSVSDDVEKLHDGKKWKAAPYDKVGTVQSASKPLERYLGRVSRMVNRRAISLEKFRVLVDTGNGTAGVVLPRLLRDLCCQVETLNAEPKPNPDRECEPRAATLKATADRAKASKVQLAAATDIDADRVIFFDEHAQGIPEDVIGCIFAKHVLAKTKGSVVVPINSSIIMERVCKEAGVKLHYCKVGQPATMEAIKSHRAVFSYEESGKYYFVKDEFWCDGILATMKFLEVMAARKKTASQLAGEFPALAQSKTKLPCTDKEKTKLYPELKKALSSHPFADVDRMIEMDGLKTIYKNGSWLLIRTSGTEPLVRVFAESEKETVAKDIMDYGVGLVKAAIGK